MLQKLLKHLHKTASWVTSSRSRCLRSIFGSVDKQESEAHKSWENLRISCEWVWSYTTKQFCLSAPTSSACDSERFLPISTFYLIGIHGMFLLGRFTLVLFLQTHFWFDYSLRLLLLSRREWQTCTSLLCWFHCVWRKSSQNGCRLTGGILSVQWKMRIDEIITSEKVKWVIHEFVR